MRIQWEAAWKARLLRNHMRPGASTPTFFAAAGCPRGSCTWGIEERARRPTPVVQLPSSPSWAGWPQEDESSPLLLAIRLMTSSREEAAPPQPRVPPAGLRPGWGRLSGDCRRRKPLPPGTQSLPLRTHRASWEAGGVRGHLLCKFSFHTTGRKWFSPKRVH